MKTFWQEKTLLHRLYHQRDAEAFGQLYDQYAPKIYRYVYFKVATQTEAEDLTADVFLKTWEYVQRHGQDPEKRISNFRAFVYRLARNAVVDHYRQRTERHLLADDAMLERLAPPDEHSIDRQVSQASDRVFLEQVLHELKDEYRELIILKYIEGLSTREIALITEKTTGAVRVSMHRAIQALREEITKRESTSPDRTP